MPDKFAILLAAARAAAWIGERLSGPAAPPARPLRHSDPRAESAVAFSGHPWYLAGITVGGPVSDFGSHSGLKAAVRPAGAGTGRDLLETAHYAALSGMASRIDRSRLRLDGRALERTAIEFRPWGWIERASGAGLRAEAEAATVATDCFLSVVRLANEGPRPLAPRPGLEFFDDPDPADEAMQPLRLSRGGRWRAACDAGTARLRYRRRTGPGPLAFDDTRFCRALRASFGPLRLRRIRRRPGGRLHVLFLGDAVPLDPAGRATLWILEGCGETPAEAEAALERGARALAAGPEAALDAVRRDWSAFVGALPAPPPGTPADDRRTLEIAATGLRMSAYAPRGRMRGRATLPSKVHFNLFALWDLAIQALGLKEWDLPLAKETLAFVLSAQRPDGSLVYGIEHDGSAYDPLLEGVSQPPVVALAVREVFEADGARDRAWLAPLHERLLRYAAWWERARDPEGDGLFSYRNALESGWDDTPRIPNPRVPPVRALGLDLGNLSGLAPARAIAPVDLNAWMFTFYESLAALARHLGRPAAEAAAAEAKARALAARVEATLWDEEAGAYLDREIAPDGTPGRFVRVLTPAIAWPLFAGLARDRARVERLVREHLLDPAKFLGDPDDPERPRFPVPTVAYSDPAYGHAEDGYYWHGQVWLVPCWAVLVGLRRYGYLEEAATLRSRVLRLLSRCPGGLFETYDALTGRIGFGSGSLSGAGEPACFQIGLTTAIAALIVLGRHGRYPPAALAGAPVSATPSRAAP